MNKSLAILNSNRRSNGYFNIATHDNPHPSRRSKAAPVSVKNSPRTAALYVLLLAGQYAVEATQVLKTPPPKKSDAVNPKVNTAAKSNDNEAGEFDSKVRERPDLGTPKRNFNESHASGIQPTSPATPVKLQENFHRNASASSNLTGAVPVLTSAVSDDPHLANDSRSDTSSPNVLRAQPHKRSADDNNTPRSTAASEVQTEEHPLIAARQKAARNLLGEAAEGASDADLLAFANTIHANAEKGDNNDIVRDADLALWKEEAIIWCAESGDNRFPVSEEKCLEIFKEAWDIALNPPPPPAGFKTWQQAREEVEKNMTANERVKYMLGPNGSVGGAARINAKATEFYYRQFVDYIEEHLYRFATAKAIANAGLAGLSRLEMEYPINAAQVIRSVSLNTHVRRGNNPLIGILPRIIPLTNTNPAAYIFQFGGSRWNETFGVIGPNGEFRFATRDSLWLFRNQKGAAEVKLSNHGILRAMGISFATHAKSYNSECRISNLGDCPIDSFVVDKGRGLGYFTYLDGKTVKEIMELQIREEVKLLIKSFKEGNDGKGIIDKIFSAIIPFYDQIIDGINDPGHEFNIEDIALDLIDLGLTLTAIGKAGFTSLKVGLVHARATLASGQGFLAALRSLKSNIRISKFIRKSGGELLDYISPPFTNFNVNRMVMDANLPAEGLKKMKNFDGTDVVRCKRGLFGDCSFNWRSRNENEILENSNYLDDIYENVYATYKHVINTDLKKFIDDRADLEVPKVLYRAQPRPGAEAIDGVSYTEVGFTGPAHSTYDDVLASAIRHTASAKGIKDKAASFSGSRGVAESFMLENRKKGYKLFKIDKPVGFNPFRGIENIIKYEGLRLVREGKITEEELVDACHHVFVTKEYEYFYVGNFGKIPQNLVTEV
ncbi:hypothetical protein PHO31112_05290 [Pandoraea horticolens]|uniref:Uncharacterized protein n=1 Tax=Pandoraea horticolens TaxID=2508298 RepID=A0A5E4ZBN3_9BURK|nr:hypothetical protein [Pandoraea horticolens]VVE58258.1 hypothetical protein PHO31112_05290 [Pandoraea horticolens]